MMDLKKYIGCILVPDKIAESGYRYKYSPAGSDSYPMCSIIVRAGEGTPDDPDYLLQLTLVDHHRIKSIIRIKEIWDVGSLTLKFDDETEKLAEKILTDIVDGFPRNMGYYSMDSFEWKSLLCERFLAGKYYLDSRIFQSASFAENTYDYPNKTLYWETTFGNRIARVAIFYDKKTMEVNDFSCWCIYDNRVGSAAKVPLKIHEKFCLDFHQYLICK